MRKLLLLLPAVVLATLAFFGATASSASAGSIYATGAGWVSFQPFTGKHYWHFMCLHTADRKETRARLDSRSTTRHSRFRAKSPSTASTSFRFWA